jgi:transcriptional regulator with XRE-family HTH domain
LTLVANATKIFFNMKPGQRIAQYLKDKGVSQEQLARKCGLDPSTVSRHITGDRMVSAEAIRAYHIGTDGELNALELLGIKAA